MELKVKRNEMSLICFVVGVCLYYMLKDSLIYKDSFKLILFLADFMGISYVFMKRKLSRKMLVSYAVILSISIYYFILLNNFSVLTLFVFLMVCAEIDIDHIIKWMFYSNAALIILFYFLKIGAENNTLGLQIGILILLYICKIRARIRWFESVFLLIIAVVSAAVTTSKAAGLISIVAVLLVALSRNRVVTKILQSKFVTGIFPICYLANIFFAECVEKNRVPVIGGVLPFSVNQVIISFSKALDEIMSWRLTLTGQSLRYFGFSLFGGNIDVESLQLDQYTYFYLDSGYINILQGWGLIFSIVLMTLMVVIMRYFVKMERYDLIISGICLALWAVNEPILNLVTHNFIIIYGAQAIHYFISNPITHENSNYYGRINGHGNT